MVKNNINHNFYCLGSLLVVCVILVSIGLFLVFVGEGKSETKIYNTIHYSGMVMHSLDQTFNSEQIKKHRSIMSENSGFTVGPKGVHIFILGSSTVSRPQYKCHK